MEFHSFWYEIQIVELKDLEFNSKSKIFWYQTLDLELELPIPIPIPYLQFHIPITAWGFICYMELELELELELGMEIEMELGFNRESKIVAETKKLCWKIGDRNKVWRIKRESKVYDEIK